MLKSSFNLIIEEILTFEYIVKPMGFDRILYIFGTMEASNEFGDDNFAGDEFGLYMKKDKVCEII